MHEVSIVLPQGSVVSVLTVSKTDSDGVDVTVLSSGWEQAQQ